MASATAWDLQPRHIAWNISCQIKSNSRVEGVGERGGVGGEENLIWKEKWSGGGEEEKWIYDEEGLLSMGWQEANGQEE